VGEWTEDDLIELRLVERKAHLFQNLALLAEDPSHRLSVKARHIQERLNTWRAESRRRPMGELFASILEETDWCARVACLQNGDLRVSNLHFLLERGVQFDSFQRKGLTEFLRFLERLEENDKDLGT